MFNEVFKYIRNTWQQAANVLGQRAKKEQEVLATTPQVNETGIVKGIEKGAGNIATVGESLGKTILSPELGVSPFDIINTGAFGENQVADIFRSILTKINPSNEIITKKEIARFINILGLETGVGLLSAADSSLGYILATTINLVDKTINSGLYRSLEYVGNSIDTNKILDVASILQFYRRHPDKKEWFVNELTKEGYDGDNIAKLLELTDNLLGLNDLIQARFRGTIKSESELYNRAYAIGFDADVVDKIRFNSIPLFGFGESIEMWRRGIKPESFNDYFDDLRKQGWYDERIETAKETSYHLPDVMTLKGFIVKDLRNDKIVNKYELDSGLNKDFLDEAFKVGVPNELAKLYYRDTWQTPPFFILEHLYTSGKIPKEDFDTLMRFAGFSPYFIKLFSQSLQPALTQADIKDLYKYQVIKAEDIPTELGKIGIPGNLAERLKELWIASVKLASPLEQTASHIKVEKIKGLTESLIIRSYKDRVITYQQALTYFEKAGYDTDTAEMYLKLTDYEINSITTRNTFDLIKQKLETGQITIEEAISKLQGLNLTTGQLELYETELDKVVHHKPKLPSESEASKWFKKGLLTVEEYSNILGLLGYSEAWIPYFLIIEGVNPEVIKGIGLSVPDAIIKK